MTICAGTLEDAFDIIVVGSGAAGLTAAMSALDVGATVAVLEKASTLGGTSALSGGMTWIPCSRMAVDAGFEDSRDDALTYMKTITKGYATDDMLRAHLERGPEMLDYLLAGAGLRFSLIGSFPDYHPEFEGGRAGGRSIEPVLYDGKQLGELRAYLRDDPRPPFEQREYFEVWQTYRNFRWDELERRRSDGILARGGALVAPLLKAVADRGGTLAVGESVQRLLADGERVVGVRTTSGDIAARSAVILASGGFEWDEDLCRRFLSGPVTSRCSTPTNVGDGLRMAMAVGADLANMNEAWWGVFANVPGLTTAEGRELGTIVTVERSLPGSLIVNARGERFTNESGSYYAFGKVLAAFDEGTYGYRNLPAYLIGDARYVRSYGILGANNPQALPDWLTAGDSLADLAARLGVDPKGLASSVARFNAQAEIGEDSDFQRGESAYDRYFGDYTQPHPNLAPLLEPPFVALELQCGAIGTKGGVRTDLNGRALDPWGRSIDGLFAVGNVAAHPIAFGYLGAGSTLGPGMTMGRAAGRTAASVRSSV